MKDWKEEVQKLKDKRDKKEITNYAIGKALKLKPSNLKAMFDFKNVPSLENYIRIKNFIAKYKK